MNRFLSDEEIALLKKYEVESKAVCNEEPVVRSLVIAGEPVNAGGGTKAKIFNAIFYAAMLLLVVGALIFAFNSDPGKSIFGYRFYNVATGSMTPSQYSKANNLKGGFRAGDMIIIKLCDPLDVNIGDIITFIPGLNSKAYLTHRVTGIKNNLAGSDGLYFVTRGDANNADDPPISADMLIGKKVFTIPKIGAVIAYIQNNLIISLVIIISSMLLIFTLGTYFSKGGREAT